MEYEKYIIDNIMSMSGKYTPYQIFTDWITLSAISIQNACKLIHDKTYEHREELYCNVAKKYSADELRILSNMTGALSLLLGDKMCDVLGEIYMKHWCESWVRKHMLKKYIHIDSEERVQPSHYVEGCQ